jgi:transcriptional regulator with XRE-family HTH domain
MDKHIPIEVFTFVVFFMSRQQYYEKSTFPDMKHNTAKTGRPTSRIDGKALRALRKESGYSSQLALAEEVYKRANKVAATPEVMKNSAGRWERKGTVAADMLKHLADVLNTTDSVLKGARPDPAPCRIDEFEKRFNALIASGPSPELAKALEHCAVDEEETAPARELATRVARRLEAAQLSQDQSEFAKLAALTGYNVSELNQPTSHEGFWMFIGTGAPGPERSEILRGVTSVLHAVRTELQDVLDRQHESDAHVLFNQEQHWFRVTIQHARVSQWTRTLRFARCQPDELGLQWSTPTWLDQFWLTNLPHDAYGHANFVTGFDGVRIPAECTNLRFAITQRPSAEEFEKLGMEAPLKIIAMCAGDLAELHSDTIESFKKEGNAHHIVVNRLAANLWTDLQPWMAEWPLECWEFWLGQSRIDVCLEVPYRLWANSKVPPSFGNRLSVVLVEQLADGGVKTVPWRQKDVAIVFEGLEKFRQETLQLQAQSPPQLPAA